MARKPARRGRPRSLESEEAILEATGELLSSEGYFGLTVSKVAARARQQIHHLPTLAYQGTPGDGRF